MKKEVRKEKGKEIKKYLLGMVGVFGVLLVIIGTIYNSYAYLEPVREISFSSQNLNYEENTSGSWNLEKSTEQISKEKATITFDIKP